MRVDYVDHMGDDRTVVNAARVSFDKFHEVFTEGDAKLIKYLAKHGHISPFFHPQISLRMTVPFFVANQLKRHQVGLAINEVSRRYVDTPPEFYITDRLGIRAENKKQGAKDGEYITLLTQEIGWSMPPTVEKFLRSKWQEALEDYCFLLDNDVSPEDARMVLPLATYTSWVWTGSLYAFARIYNLRSKTDAQRQTREVAQLISDIISPLFPHSWSALCQKSE